MKCQRVACMREATISFARHEMGQPARERTHAYFCSSHSTLIDIAIKGGVWHDKDERGVPGRGTP